MILLRGYKVWDATAGYAAVSFESTGRGIIVTGKPEILIRPPMALEKCIELAPKEASILSRCRSDRRLITQIDRLLGDQWLLLDAEWRQRIPLDAVLDDKRTTESLFTMARSMLNLAGVNGMQIGRAQGTAVLTMAGYGLVGLGALYEKVVDYESGCGVCWQGFRTRTS